MASEFVLTSEETELLLKFEAAPSLEKLSKLSGKDISGLSRALSRIASKLPVIEKQGGRWSLTDQGRLLNTQTRDSIQFQNSLFRQQATLRIGTNREFAARIIGPRMDEILRLFPQTTLIVNAYESGSESALLEGLIDFGIDCERPFDPSIAYKLVVDEQVITVCSPDFKRRFSKQLKEKALFNLPHLLCDRLFPDKFLSRSENLFLTVAKFNDIATTRAACEAGVGWALLPAYSVRRELESGTLLQIDIPEQGRSRYGIWWMRRRTTLQTPAKKLLKWLSGVEL